MLGHVLQSPWPAKVLPLDQAMQHLVGYGNKWTALQHSFEMSIIIVGVATQHLVAHDERDIVGTLQTERLPQRQRKEEDPKSCRALIDWPIDSRVAALANATCCSQATRNVHAHRGLFAGEGIHKAHFLHGQLQC